MGELSTVRGVAEGHRARCEECGGRFTMPPRGWWTWPDGLTYPAPWFCRSCARPRAETWPAAREGPTSGPAAPSEPSTPVPGPSPVSLARARRRAAGGP